MKKEEDTRQRTVPSQTREQDTLRGRNRQHENSNIEIGTKAKQHDDIPQAIVENRTKHGETKKRQEELGLRLQRKLTREAILDMVESQYLTMEEGEVELKDLESREVENNKDQ